MANGLRTVLRSNLDLRGGFLRKVECRLYLVILFLFPVFSSFFSGDAQSISADVEGLMAFKAAADPGGVLNQSWTGNTSPCGNSSTRSWKGVMCNDRGRVSWVILSNLGLSGAFAENTMSKLSELKVLTVSYNSFSGSLPDDMSNVTGLLQLWAQHAGFSGPFPNFLTNASRIVTVDLSGNNLSGPIPDLSGLATAISLNLSKNFFTRNIPPLPPGLSTLDLSSNSLTGQIPSGLAQKFTNASFAGNDGLCGDPLTTLCDLASPPPKSPNSSANYSSPDVSHTKISDNPSASPSSGDSNEHNSHKKGLSKSVIAIIVVLDVLLLAIVIAIIIFYYHRKKNIRDIDEKPTTKAVDETTVHDNNAQLAISGIPETEKSKLVFFESSLHKFDLEDLLRASAEMLGKGSLGTAYKAVLESGSVVAVKRLRDVRDMGKKEFDQQMEQLGRLRHPNLVPLRAFYYAKEEKLLVYDFMTNGNLFSLLHANRGPGGTPLDWTSRLHIAQDVAVGLSYLHQEYESQKIPHGNIKSSNILLGKNFEVCIGDFGLMPLMTPAMAAQRMAGYRAPEYNHTKRISQKSDVYSFGVLLLELLTGRQPAQSFQGDGIDLPKWVQSVVREEWTGEVFDLELKSYRHGEEEMVSLLQIAMACVTSNPDQRPKMAHVVKQIEDIRQEDSFVDSESFESYSGDKESYGSRDAPFNL